jgi:hypothetical protein
VLNAWSLYRELGGEQRKLLRDKQIAGARPVADFIALLKPLGQLDAAAERGRRQVGRVAFASGMAAFVGGLFGVTAQAPALFFAIPAGLAALCLGFALIWRSLRAIDVSDNLRNVALPLLRVLQDEADAASPVTLKLDLRRADIPDKLVDRNTVNGAGGRIIVESLYRDPWMSGRAVLADGTKLSFEAVDELRKRRQTRQTASGKSKTKIKSRFWSTYRVALVLPDEHYASAMAATTPKLSRTVKGDAPPRDPLVFLDLVAEGYRRATLKAPPTAGRS